MADWHTLSDDAKLMLAGHFSFGSKTSLTFQTPWNVTQRGMTALMEVVNAGLLTREIGTEGLYAHTFRPTVEFTGIRRWMEQNKEKAKGFRVMVGDAERQERPPSDWPVPAGHKRHPK